MSKAESPNFNHISLQNIAEDLSQHHITLINLIQK